MSAKEFSPHDHAACVAQTLEVTEAQCRAQKLQLTPVRRRVLEILLERHQAMGAYEVLDILSEEGLGSQPPVAYRALDFLVKHGFAHRIERLNAYTACAHPGHHHAPMFLICRNCRTVAESHLGGQGSDVQSAADSAGFAIERITIEAEGLCPACLPQASAT